MRKTPSAGGGDPPLVRLTVADFSDIAFEFKLASLRSGLSMNFDSPPLSPEKL